MPYRRAGRILIAVLLSAILAAACTDGSASDAAAATSDADDTGKPVDAWQQLCDAIGTRLGTWSGQGPAVADVEFRALIRKWAATESLVPELSRKPSIVDDMTALMCPAVRAQALVVLYTVDLASLLPRSDDS